MPPDVCHLLVVGGGLRRAHTEGEQQMTHYVMGIDNLFRVEAENEEAAREELRRRLREGELYDQDEVVFDVVDVEE